MAGTKEKNLSFEEALTRLEEANEALRQPGISLDEAIKLYEKGIDYYKRCEETLASAKQKIEKIEE